MRVDDGLRAIPDAGSTPAASTKFFKKTTVGLDDDLRDCSLGMHFPGISC